MRFSIVLICLCTFAGLPLPVFVELVSTQAVEFESPWEEKEETSEEKEVVAGSSVRRRVRVVGTSLGQITDVVAKPPKTSLYTCQLPVIDGHLLANGLCAPLLI